VIPYSEVTTRMGWNRAATQVEARSSPRAAIMNGGGAEESTSSARTKRSPA